MGYDRDSSERKDGGPEERPVEPLRILIVDDSEDDCQLVLQQLRRSGFQPEHRRVFTPESMSEALEAGSWDLVICDYQMPRFSAPAALELFQKRQIDIPFIVVSGTVGEALAVKMMVQGAHDYLMKDRLDRLGEAVRREMGQAQVRAERRRAGEQRDHLNRVLRAIRSVNQLIVREKEPRRLVQRACDTIVESRGFNGAWIVVSDTPSGEPFSGRSLIPEEAFNSFFARFRAGKLPPCCRRSRSGGAVQFIESMRRTCDDCPLAVIYKGTPALTTSIAYGGRLFGFLGVSLPGDLAVDEEEFSLFEEIAGDLGFALNTINVDAQRDRSERTLDAIFEAAADGMLLADTETGHFVLANRAICRMLGYSNEEIKTLSVSDIHLAEDLPRVSAQFEKQASGEITLASDIPVKRKDGSVFPADVNSTPLELDGRLHLLGIFRDISERKRAEEELRENVESLRQARAHLVQQARWLQALNSVAGEIARRNSLDSIFQVVLGHLEGSYSLAVGGICLFAENSGACLTSALSAQGRSLARRLGIKVGFPLPLAEVFPPTADSTDLPRTLHLSDIDDSVVSASTARLLQRLREQRLETLTMVDLEYEKSRTGLLFMLFHDRLTHSEVECRFLKGMAEYMSVAVQNRRLYENLEQSYEQLKKTQQVMMEQERMNAMGQMASGIAHDINNTLAPITLYAEALMASDLGSSEPARRYLATIMSAVGDIEAITHRLRAFYKREEVDQVEAVDLRAVVETVVELTRPRWKNVPNRYGIEIALKTQVAPRIASILGNRTEIREALVNLVLNAVDAMPDGGTITIRAGRHGKGKEERRLSLEVSDTGVGMNEEQLQRCLEPFYTTKGPKGSGLGLPAVYGIVQRHRGEIEIDSNPGNGTTVRLLFPFPHETPKKAAGKKGPPVELPPLRILCVDDNPSVREVLEEMLRQHGHTVESFEDGAAAVEAFELALEGGQSFQLVITDLGMPHMDGQEVARRIKEIAPVVPVILLSGWGGFMNMGQELPPHVDCALGKPPTMARLLPAIGELISRGNETEAKESG